MSKSKNNKNVFLGNQGQSMPLMLVLLIIFTIIFLLSMTMYFVSGTIANLNGSKAAVDEEIGAFSIPLFGDDEEQATGNTSNTESSGTNQRSNSTTSNTSTTMKETITSQTTTNNPTQTDNNGNFIDETVDTVNNNIPTIAPTGIFEPVITQTGGLLNNLFGN